MSGDLQVTPELRKKAAEDNAAPLKRLGLNPDVVEVWEDGYRTAKEPYAFEWWYFDAELELTVDLAGVKAKESGRVIFDKMMFH